LVAFQFLETTIDLIGIFAFVKDGVELEIGWVSGYEFALRIRLVLLLKMPKLGVLHLL